MCICHLYLLSSLLQPLMPSVITDTTPSAICLSHVHMPLIPFVITATTPNAICPSHMHICHLSQPPMTSFITATTSICPIHKTAITLLCQVMCIEQISLVITVSAPTGISDLCLLSSLTLLQLRLSQYAHSPTPGGRGRTSRTSSGRNIRPDVPVRSGP